MTPEIPQIEPAEVARRLAHDGDGDGRPVLLDCREPEELTISRIEGAVHIPMRDVPLRLGELDPEREIIVFCRSGKRSLSVCSLLLAQGFGRVLNLRGGINAWTDTVDPTQPRY